MTYEDMKDSGVSWIGRIPYGWKIYSLSQISSQVKTKNTLLQESNLLSLSYGKIKRKDIESNTGLLPQSFDGYNIIKSGDIVLRLTDLQNDHTSLRVGQAKEQGIITSAYVTIRPTDTSISSFLYYQLHSYDIKKGFYGMGSGVRQGLTYDEVKRIKVVIPDSESSFAITAYLDERCEEIDTIISEVQASIDDYKLWKASVIYQAVTKGLNHEVPMQDSGVSWIGLIPCSWKRMKVTYLFSVIGSGTTPASIDSSYYNGTIPWLQSGDIKGDCITDTSKKITQSALDDNSTLKIYRAPFIAVAMYGASIANTGIVSIDACTNQACCVLSGVRGIIDFRYVYYAICAAKEELLLSSRGGTQPNISQEIIKQLRIPVPGINEQIQISKYLDEKIAEIESMIKEKEILIAELESYKKSLIYEAVTGKRKVV